MLRRRITLICVGYTGVQSHMTVFRREVAPSSVADPVVDDNLSHSAAAHSPNRTAVHSFSRILELLVLFHFKYPIP